VTCGVILLAAGRSTRFGSDKREARIKGMPLLLYTVQQYTALSCPILVVINQSLSQNTVSELEKTSQLLVMPEPSDNPTVYGMADSLAAAIKRVSMLGWNASLIGLGDMPFVQPETLKQLHNGLQSCSAVVPVYNGQWGHPVGFRQHYFSELAKLNGDRGGRSVLESARPMQYEVNDSGVVSDIDTPEQLHSLLNKTN